MYDKFEVCPVCKHGVIKNETILVDDLVSKESFALVSCQKCQLHFLNPFPSKETYANYFRNNPESSTPVLSKILNKKIENKLANLQLKIIDQYKGSSLLDFNNQDSNFLKRLPQNWQLVNLNAYKASKINSINVLSLSNIDDLNKNDKFDFITLWNGLTGVVHLKATLKKLSKHVSEKGHIILKLPCLNTIKQSLNLEELPYLDVPRTMYFLNRNALDYLSRKINLHVVDEIPISNSPHRVMHQKKILKSKKLNSLDFLLSSLKSVKVAKSTNDCSEVIYVLKK